MPEDVHDIVEFQQAIARNTGEIAAPRSWLTDEEVRIAYRLFLGREPESDSVVEAWRPRNFAELRRSFLNSPEFREQHPEIFAPSVRSNMPQNIDHYQFLTIVKQALKPRSYLEVGYAEGASLLADPIPDFILGIDPTPQITESASTQLRDIRAALLLRMSSDDAFAFLQSERLLGKQNFDLCFVDGLHHCEVVLRDIANCATLSRENALILVHDVFPHTEEQASRVQCPGAWMGDVYKVVPVFWQFLGEVPSILISDLPPSGMFMVRAVPGLGSAIMSKYQQMVSQMHECEFATAVPRMRMKSTTYRSPELPDFLCPSDEAAMTALRSSLGTLTRVSSSQAPTGGPSASTIVPIAPESPLTAGNEMAQPLREKRILSVDTSVESAALVSSIADFGKCELGGLLQRMLLYPALSNPPQLRLFREEQLTPESVTEHYTWVDPPEISVYAVSDHVLGGGGLLRKEDAIWLPRDCFPGYLAASLDGGQLPLYWGGSVQLRSPQEIVIDYPCASPMHPNLIHGHFLLEILPRLYLLRVLRDVGVEFRIVLPNNLPDWAKQFVSLYFPNEEFIWYDFHQEVIRASAFIIPSMMHTDRSQIHPFFNRVGTDLLVRAKTAFPEAPPVELPDRVYLSRTRVATDWHRIQNEGEVEDVMRELDFAIVHPQELSISQQLNIYASAKVICAEYSSALHNAMFAKRGTKIIALNRVNWYQSLLGQVLSQPLAIIAPADGVMRDWRLHALGQGPVVFEINEAELREQVKAFLDD